MRNVAVLSALALASALFAVLPGAASAQVATSPTGLVCLTYNSTTGTAIARLGYRNAGLTIEDIGPGDFNMFTAPPADRGQPNQFVPGLGSWDIFMAAVNLPVTWKIDGTSADTGALTGSDVVFDRPCPDRGPSISAVSPTAVAPGATSQLLTVFGQGLKNATLTVSGTGVTVGAPSDTTEQRIEVPITVDPGSTGTRDVLVTDSNGYEVGCRGCLVLDPNASTVGPTGPQGPPGPKGATGAPGPAGTSGGGTTVKHVTGSPVRLNRHGVASARATCPRGTSVISGGYTLSGRGHTHNVSVMATRATSARTWAVRLRATGSGAKRRLTVSASCLR
jgi:hypothetical protein